MIFGRAYFYFSPRACCFDGHAAIARIGLLRRASIAEPADTSRATSRLKFYYMARHTSRMSMHADSLLRRSGLAAQSPICADNISLLSYFAIISGAPI